MKLVPHITKGFHLHFFALIEKVQIFIESLVARQFFQTFFQNLNRLIVFARLSRQ